jgi:hypothetical protein
MGRLGVVRFLTRRFTAAARLSLHPPAVGAGDAQVLAIFRDRSARYVDAFVAQHFRDLLVG